MTQPTLNDFRSRHVTREIDDCLSTILGNDERQKPIILESDFIKKVLPLLMHPFTENNLIEYKKYVVELTNPLRVASNEKESKILFEVPPMYLRPSTTITADSQTASIGNVLEHISIQRERTLEDFEPLILEYLTHVSLKTTPHKDILLPLANILARYGRTFVDDKGVPLYTLDNSDSKAIITTSDTESKQDYED